MSDYLATDQAQIKAIFDQVHGSPLEVVIAIAKLVGITDTATIAKAVGRTTRSVQKAKQASFGEAGFGETGFASETGFADGAKQDSPEAKQASPSKERSFPQTPFKKETTQPGTTVAAQLLDARAHCADATKVSWKEMIRKLHDAAGECLDPTSYENQHCAAANGWIAAGADLDLDILPVIAAKARGLKRHSVSSLAYFSKPVAKALEMRKAGLPSVPDVAMSRQDEKAAVRRKNDAIFAKFNNRAEASP